MTAEQVAQYTSMAEALERQELEQHTHEGGGTHPSPQVYGQLLAIYLLVNDLPNAKFLWKRIPTALKEDSADLNAIWSVGTSLIGREFPAVYQAISAYQWPGHLNNIMNLIKETTRQRVIDLVAKAYATIHIDKLTAFLGFQTGEETLALVTPLGWSRDAEEESFLHPVRPSAAQAQNNSASSVGKIDQLQLMMSSDEQLGKLTEYVSFLENF